MSLLWMEVFQKTATKNCVIQMGSGKWSGKEGAHITHTYQIPGIYNITLTVTDNNGANSTATVSIHVYDNRPDLIVSDIHGILKSHRKEIL